MSGLGDHVDEMQPSRPLDDATTEALLAGRTRGAGDDLGVVAAFVEELRGMAVAPVPPPSPALARALAEGLATEKGDLPATAGSNVPGPARQAAGLPKWRKRTMVAQVLGGVAAKLAGLGLAAKAGVGLSVALTSVGGAAVAGVPVAQDAVEAVSPVEFDEGAGDKDNFGERVSADARDGGVDGQVISAEARARAEARRAAKQVEKAKDGGRRGDAGRRGGEHRGGAATSGAPASPGVEGLERAGTTPAEGHVPSETSATPGAGEDAGRPGGTPAGPPEGVPPTDAPDDAPGRSGATPVSPRR